MRGGERLRRKEKERIEHAQHIAQMLEIPITPGKISRDIIMTLELIRCELTIADSRVEERIARMFPIDIVDLMIASIDLNESAKNFRAIIDKRL